MIEKFSSCWVPDLDGELSIAGLLSHPAKFPSIPCEIYRDPYRDFVNQKRIFKRIRIAYSSSGPEPQRTEFENILFSQLANSTIKDRRGARAARLRFAHSLYQGGSKNMESPSVRRFKYILNNSEYIVARSGYSTVMDLLAVKKNAILVPTPGQTEQEYLGYYLHEKKWMYTVAEKNFNLQDGNECF